MRDSKEIYCIRNGVDLYLVNDDILTVYFMSSRLRKQYKVSRLTIKLLELLDGEKNILEIFNDLVESFDIELEIKELYAILDKFSELNIITQTLVDKGISVSLETRYDRQLNFMSDFLNENQQYHSFEKLRSSIILIFGCGAIGGDIAIHLAMCGVENFILFDDDIVEESDVSRHLYFKEEYIGLNKVDALSKYLKEINADISTTNLVRNLVPESEIEELIDTSTFVINTADEPYIGYTSTKISRYCTKINKTHFIAGGFDAHLASTGELIIPGITPCVDCYASHFEEALKGWKPKTHPVKNRHLEIGGLSCLSLFSASYAAIEIIKSICGLVDPNKYSKVRGEFLFTRMEIDYLNVIRDKNCRFCGDK